MKSNNYQFSFNLDKNFEATPDQNDYLELINDVFPYLKMKTITFAIFILSLIPLFIQIYASTIIPETGRIGQNLFLIVFSFSCKSIIFLRLGSEYQNKLGLHYFLTLIILIQLTDFIVVFIIESSFSLFIFRNSSSLSFYILSVIDLQKFKEDEIVQFKNQQRPVVQNCDLLDLHDTFAKLKTKESSSFNYQSYNNSESFSYQPYSERSRPTKKMMVRTTIKSSNLSNIIQQPFIDEQESSFAVNIYKLILFHFIVFSSSSQSSFILLLINQAIIYGVITTKIIKKLFV